MHKAVIERYNIGNKATINSFEILKNCAYEMKEAINKSLEEIGEIMYKNWDAQKNLHPLMTNESISKAEKIAKKNNALGFKCNGAGGGGSATILADPLRVYSLKNELIKNGYTLLPCKLCFDGVFSYKK
jgi:galactokinase/mevalonate kinase-like predicted kinase